MVTRARTRTAIPRTITHGPWSSVRTTRDIGDDPPTVLMDATNLYIADPAGRSGAYALPGFTLQNAGVPITTSATTFRGQNSFSHTDLSGNTTNFAVWNGKLFRIDANLQTYTDVTPTPIDSAVTTRVYGTTSIGQLIITDGVHRPWVASNLSATPITATAIDFDGMGTAWAAWGPPRAYAGSLIFTLVSVGGVACRMDIAWSVPADPAVGYQQPDYDFRWTLEQSGTGPIYGTYAENTQFYYWRSNSIGSLSGIPGPSFQGQATHDAISKNVGTLAPQSIIPFGDNIFFVDQVGRPYMLAQGNRALEPLWLEMREIVDESTFGFPAVTQSVCTAGFEPNLNLYIVAPWSPLPSQDGPAIEGYTFDARTGAYFGRFQIADGVQLDSLGTFTDASGRGVLVVQGSLAIPTNAQVADSGYFWSMNSLAGTGSLLVTEDTPGLILTTEDGKWLTTEGSTVNWTDNGNPKVVSATTTRMAYDLTTVITADRAMALVGNTSPCVVSMLTAAVAETVEGTPTPSASQDGIFKLVVGSAGIQGRGLTITIAPTTTDTQWSLQNCAAVLIESLATPEDY